MQDWLNQRTPREQMVLLFGGVLLVTALLYFLVWEPLLQERQQLRTLVQAQQSDLAWMRSAAQEIQQYRQNLTLTDKTPHSSSVSLLSLIDRSMRQTSLAQADKRIEPKGDDAVRVSFEAVNFTALVQWLGYLANQHQIHSETITLDKTKQVGEVKARLLLVW